ncbi:MAG TPA: hypothetical protein VKZ79_19170 [Alphaproteobacteria bacterium]|jgi:hypothetical protein|nr:hypothetical protein [Alphaproteobacteria bacterium]
MNPSSKQALAAGIAGLLAAAGMSGAQAATTWIDCTGQMVTTKAGKADAPVQVHEIFQIDDQAKGLFKYSEVRKSADPEPVTEFDDKSIVWAEKPDLGALDASWQGKIDRAAMTLTQEYNQGPEKTTWTEQCKPTSAPQLASSLPADQPPAQQAAPTPADQKKAPAGKPADKTKPAKAPAPQKQG